MTVALRNRLCSVHFPKCLLGSSDSNWRDQRDAGGLRVGLSQTRAASRVAIRVSKETDASVRSFLRRQGMANDTLSNFVEEAVCWRVLDETVARTKMRNARKSIARIDAAIDAAVKSVRRDESSRRIG